MRQELGRDPGDPVRSACGGVLISASCLRSVGRDDAQGRWPPAPGQAHPDLRVLRLSPSCLTLSGERAIRILTTWSGRNRRPSRGAHPYAASRSQGYGFSSPPGQGHPTTGRAVTQSLSTDRLSCYPSPMKNTARILNPAVLLPVFVVALLAACLPPSPVTHPAMAPPEELGLGAAGTPVVPVPEERWVGGELKPGPIHFDSTWKTGEPGDTPFPHAVAIAGDTVFYATGQGIQTADVSNPAKPVKGRYGSLRQGVGGWGYFPTSDQDFYVADIDVSRGNGCLAATANREAGFIVWDTCGVRPIVLYQDAGSPGRFPTRVYVAKLADGREYAFASDANGDGIAMYDLTAAGELEQCYENTAQELVVRLPFRQTKDPFPGRRDCLGLDLISAMQNAPGEIYSGLVQVERGEIRKTSLGDFAPAIQSRDDRFSYRSVRENLFFRHDRGPFSSVVGGRPDSDPGFPPSLPRAQPESKPGSGNRSPTCRLALTEHGVVGVGESSVPEIHSKSFDPAIVGDENLFADGRGVKPARHRNGRVLPGSPTREPWSEEGVVPSAAHEKTLPQDCGVFKGFLPNGGTAPHGVDDFLVTTTSGVTVNIYRVTGDGDFSLRLSGRLDGNVGTAVMFTLDGQISEVAGRFFPQEALPRAPPSEAGKILGRSVQPNATAVGHGKDFRHGSLLSAGSVVTWGASEVDRRAFLAAPSATVETFVGDFKLNRAPASEAGDNPAATDFHDLRSEVFPRGVCHSSILSALISDGVDRVERSQGAGVVPVFLGVSPKRTNEDVGVAVRLGGEANHGHRRIEGALGGDLKCAPFAAVKGDVENDGLGSERSGSPGKSEELGLELGGVGLFGQVRSRVIVRHGEGTSSSAVVGRRPERSGLPPTLPRLPRAGQFRQTVPEDRGRLLFGQVVPSRNLFAAKRSLMDPGFFERRSVPSLVAREMGRQRIVFESPPVDVAGDWGEMNFPLSVWHALQAPDVLIVEENVSESVSPRLHPEDLRRLHPPPPHLAAGLDAFEGVGDGHPLALHTALEGGVVRVGRSHCGLPSEADAVKSSTLSKAVRHDRRSSYSRCRRAVEPYTLLSERTPSTPGRILRRAPGHAFSPSAEYLPIPVRTRPSSSPSVEGAASRTVSPRGARMRSAAPEAAYYPAGPASKPASSREILRDKISARSFSLARFSASNVSSFDTWARFAEKPLSKRRARRNSASAYDSIEVSPSLPAPTPEASYYLAALASTLDVKGGLALGARLGAPGNGILRRIAAGSGVARMPADGLEPGVHEEDRREIGAAHGAGLEPKLVKDVLFGPAHRRKEFAEHRVEAGLVDGRGDGFRYSIPENGGFLKGQHGVAHASSIAQASSPVYYLASLASKGSPVSTFLSIYDVSCIASEAKTPEAKTPEVKPSAWRLLGDLPQLAQRVEGRAVVQEKVASGLTPGTSEVDGSDGRSPGRESTLHQAVDSGLAAGGGIVGARVGHSRNLSQAAGGCPSGLPALAVYDVTDHSKSGARQVFLSVSEDAGKTYLYVGNTNVGGVCVPQREFLLDMSRFHPGATLAELDLTPKVHPDGFWSWYYQECHVPGTDGPPGFNDAQPRFAKVANGRAYRTMWRWADSFEIIAREPAIFSDGFETGDFSPWSSVVQ